ncbi:MAG: DUF4326 domain-containing protein [Chloroflexi bacterium]|nr:DUF4326 domain-containing protein [Chloroflexota bacterium]
MQRIQRKRTRSWKMPENTIYVGRPTRFGNPFIVRPSLYGDKYQVAHESDHIGAIAEFTTKREAQTEAVRLFEKWFNNSIADIGTELHDFRNKYGWGGFALASVVNVLRGKNLACWCKEDEPCHADVLIRLANQ